jgi:hypothetical protein
MTKRNYFLQSRPIPKKHHAGKHAGEGITDILIWERVTDPLVSVHAYIKFLINHKFICKVPFSLLAFGVARAIQVAICLVKRSPL